MINLGELGAPAGWGGESLVPPGTLRGHRGVFSFFSSAPKEQGLGTEEASGEGRGGGEGTIEFHPLRPPFTVWAVVLWQEGWGTILA